MTKFVLALVLAAATLATPLHAADSPKAHVADLKSAYIFNFIRFTDWPEQQAKGEPGKAPVHVNILYDERIFSTLSAIAEKEAGKQLGLAVDACKQTACIANASVLYIADSDRASVAQLLSMVKGKAILTVSDIPGFAEQGGMIEIKYHNKKLTFVVNLQAVKAAGLYISSQLLQLGEVVGRGNE